MDIVYEAKCTQIIVYGDVDPRNHLLIWCRYVYCFEAHKFVCTRRRQVTNVERTLGTFDYTTMRIRT